MTSKKKVAKRGFWRRIRHQIRKYRVVGSFLVAVITIVMAGITIFFAYRTIDDNWQLQKINQTVNLESVFFSEHMSSSRKNIFKIVTESDLQHFFEAKPSKSSIKKLLDDMFDKEGSSLAVDLNFIDEFYNIVIACVDKDNCQKETAISLFSGFARDSFCLFKPSFKDLGKKFLIDDFGKNMRTVALWGIKLTKAKKTKSQLTEDALDQYAKIQHKLNVLRFTKDEIALEEMKKYDETLEKLTNILCKPIND